MSFRRINNLKPSSMIYEMHYDDESKVLRAKFNNGTIGDYTGVPPEIVEQVRTAESLGSAFTKLIKNGGYHYAEVGVQ